MNISLYKQHSIETEFKGNMELIQNQIVRDSDSTIKTKIGWYVKK